MVMDQFVDEPARAAAAGCNEPACEPQQRDAGHAFHVHGNAAPYGTQAWGAGTRLRRDEGDYRRGGRRGGSAHCLRSGQRAMAIFSSAVEPKTMPAPTSVAAVTE